MVVAKQAAKPFATFDVVLREADFLARINQAIAQSLIISFSLIIFQELADNRAKHLLAEKRSFSRGTLPWHFS